MSSDTEQAISKHYSEQVVSRHYFESWKLLSEYSVSIAVCHDGGLALLRREYGEDAAFTLYSRGKGWVLKVTGGHRCSFEGKSPAQCIAQALFAKGCLDSPQWRETAGKDGEA